MRKKADKETRRRWARIAEKRYAAKFPEKIKAKLIRKNLKANFGITIDDYNRMYESQQGVCAICFRPSNKNRLGVDHDHHTGAIRGLLCDNCNHAIGKFNDDITILYSAIAYLMKHGKGLGSAQNTTTVGANG